VSVLLIIFDKKPDEYLNKLGLQFSGLDAYGFRKQRFFRQRRCFSFLYV